MTTTTFTIDCDTCPGRGRLCGDCFVPVLGKIWLQEPSVRRADPSTTGTTNATDAPERPGDPRTRDLVLSQGVALDSDELDAVSAFVRAGLVDPDEAVRARAQLTGSARSATG